MTIRNKIFLVLAIHFLAMLPQVALIAASDDRATQLKMAVQQALREASLVDDQGNRSHSISFDAFQLSEQEFQGILEDLPPLVVAIERAIRHLTEALVPGDELVEQLSLIDRITQRLSEYNMAMRGGITGWEDKNFYRDWSLASQELDLNPSKAQRQWLQKYGWNSFAELQQEAESLAGRPYRSLAEAYGDQSRNRAIIGLTHNATLIRSINYTSCSISPFASQSFVTANSEQTPMGVQIALSICVVADIWASDALVSHPWLENELHERYIRDLNTALGRVPLQLTKQ